MLKNIKIPDTIRSRTEYKRKFTLREMYRAFRSIPNAAGCLIGNKIKKSVGKGFIERLQLAVTEVNGCAACSYAHAYMALKQGMEHDEIHSFLSGDGRFIPQEESKGIFFAQHYADSRGYPKKDAYESMLQAYGEEKAKVILSAIQVMQAGNIYGIPYSAFISRLQGKPYKNSTLLYELGMQIAGFFILPFALVHGIVRSIVGFSDLRLE